MKNKKLAIETLNRKIDDAILRGDLKTFNRLARLHRNLTIKHLQVYVKT